MKYFTRSEFDSPDKKGSGEYMDCDFLEMIDRARDIADIPMHITSGYRTKEHNEAVGGSKTSSHLNGFAADIACNNSFDREKMISAFVMAGFKRIGIAHNFIHVDNDMTKRNAIWLYS